jgi:hypothetical protein
VFRPKRGNEQTHGTLFRAELSESVDHALRAAGYAAGGVRAAIGPKVSPAAQRVRSTAASGWGSTRAAIAPLTEAAQYKLRNARTEEKVSSRWPKLAGLLAVGALMGAVTAYVLRRRRLQQWEEYDPMEAVAKEREEAATPPSADEPAEPSEEQSRT